MFTSWTFCDVIICHWAMRLSAYSLFVSSAPAQLVLLFLYVSYILVYWACITILSLSLNKCLCSKAVLVACSEQ